MARPLRIPIFPLELVLFPGVPLPLHIFEPRYRRMVGDCLARPGEAGEFGVVLSRGQSIARVGCTAEILEVTHRYDDGRLDILCAGRAVFRITEVALPSSQPAAAGEDADPEAEDDPPVYPEPQPAVAGQGQQVLEAEVEYLPAPTPALDAVDASRLQALFAECHQLLFGKPPPAPPPDTSGLSPAVGASPPPPRHFGVWNPCSLPCHVANSLPLDLDFKQELLEIPTDAERAETLLEHLTRWLPQLHHLDRARRAAGGNGHALH